MGIRTFHVILRYIFLKLTLIPTLPPTAHGDDSGTWIYFMDQNILYEYHKNVLNIDPYLLPQQGGSWQNMAFLSISEHFINSSQKGILTWLPKSNQMPPHGMMVQYNTLLSESENFGWIIAKPFFWNLPLTSILMGLGVGTCGGWQTWPLCAEQNLYCVSSKSTFELDPSTPFPASFPPLLAW